MFAELTDAEVDRVGLTSAPSTGSTDGMRLVVLGGSGASTPELIDALAAWPGGTDRRPPLDVVLVGRSTAKLELVAQVPAPGRRPRSGGATDRDHPAPTDGAPRRRRRRAQPGPDRRSGRPCVRRDVPARLWPARRGDDGPGWLRQCAAHVAGDASGVGGRRRVRASALVVDLTNPAGIVVAAARRSTTCGSWPCAIRRSAARTRRAAARPAGRAGPLPLCRDEPRRLVRPRVGRRARGPGGPGRRPGRERRPADGAIAAPYVRYYRHPDQMLAAQLGTAVRAETLQGLEEELLTAYADGRGGIARRGAVWYGLAVVPLLEAWWHGATDPH